MKVGNFGRLDPELRRKGIVGLSNGSKLEEVVWNDFNGNWEKLAFESEKLIADFQNISIEKALGFDDFEIPIGKDRIQIIKARVNQSFFRSLILSSYNQRCCITNLSIPELLNASHIIPWSQNKKERLNPRNGLCLNSIHDRAFDKGLITITTDYKVLTSRYLRDFDYDRAVVDFFLKYENHTISLPDRFIPSKEFLEYHAKNIFLDC
ncbi:MAG: HNH endonuclease [Candidatus Cloacimonadales bacterium]|nr:HNH endonuclease [Candidatus Cloacimonadales bacterium]